MKINYLLPVIGVLLPVFAQAEKTSHTESTSYLSNGVFLVMIAVIILLMLVIIGMTELVKAGASQQRNRAQKSLKNDATVKTITMLVLTLALSSDLSAQDSGAVAGAPSVPFDYWGMGAQLFFVLLAVIVFEVIIIYVLFRTGMRLLRTERVIRKDAVGSFMESKLMRSITGDQTPEQEAAIMTDHEYDGIRELDNDLPAWWKYGFYLTIIVSIVYLFNYHVFSTGLSSEEEYNKEVREADEAIAEYKRANANAVDENNVVQLIDAASISAGGRVYAQNCVPCHGALGEGKEGLGPNLTDDYWLHKGGIVNVFRSVKYGWTDKGMKAWEQDLKPLEIQQVSSFILSLRGSDPPDAKPQEGELYVEEGQAADTTVVQDSLSVVNTPVQEK